ncbi:MAG: hypothetical protein A2139_06915 [Desulfobacca sp. RBG_16_60_12]|nr:MAG: hypothetical protein A2139_06915 [Desulfobacca sp. RBG_16_60_12]OHD23820.1 MAG: hypothetical protein A2Y38_17170 [Spirochaetes bacterium GWB1_59_5]
MNLNMEMILKALLFCQGVDGRRGLPIKFTAEPGTAKSSVIKQVALKHGLAVIVVIACIREPSDFAGLPIPTTKKMADKILTMVEFAAADWAVQAAEAKYVVVFLDEINQAPPAVQAALMRVVLEGCVGDLQLPSTVRFVAAMNSTEDATAGWDLALPLANRFGHMQWQAPGVEEWTDWLISLPSTPGPVDVQAEFDAEEEDDRVDAMWPQPWAKARGLVAAFVRSRPELLHDKPAAGSPQASGAWASRRTWEMATRAMTSAEIHGLSPADTDAVISSFVGDGPGRELAAFRDMCRLPDPYDLLDGKVSWQHDPTRLDVSMAILSMCAASFESTTMPNREKRASFFYKNIAKSVVEDAADLLIMPVRKMIQYRLAAVPGADPIVKHMVPMLRAAGITDQK